MLDKKVKAERRARKTRYKIRALGIPRLCVTRSLKNISAQIIVGAAGGDRVLASASSMQKELKEAGAVSNNKKSAAIVGRIIAERALEAGQKKVAFDRSGKKFHGRIKALAEAAREAGLDF